MVRMSDTASTSRPTSLSRDLGNDDDVAGGRFGRLHAEAGASMIDDRQDGAAQIDRRRIT